MSTQEVRMVRDVTQEAHRVYKVTVRTIICQTHDNGGNTHTSTRRGRVERGTQARVIVRVTIGAAHSSIHLRSSIAPATCVRLRRVVSWKAELEVTSIV